MPDGFSHSLNINQLFVDGFDPPGELTWLEESYQDPKGFWLTIKQAQDASLPWPGKSSPFEHYDFYHDIIIRNQDNMAPALRCYDPLAGWQEISYAELGAIAARKETIWMRSGVQPNQTVCIVLPLGVKYVASFLTAMKIGLIVSCLPPQGKLFLQNRLEALDPDYIVTDDLYVALLPAWHSRILPEDTVGEDIHINPEHSHTYPSGAIFGRCFDPSSETSHLPKELTSDAAYLSPLRDGMLALGLQRPGQILAAPGFHFLETQPGLLLAVLLNGGTYLMIEPDDVAKNPELLNEHSIHTMGVSAQIRDVLLKKPVAFSEPWNFWFRNPAESSDMEQWHSFIQTLGLKEVFCGNVKWDAASGGCSLFSVKRKGQAHFNVLPSAGIPWCLTDLAGGEHESLAGCGLFSTCIIGKGNGEKTTTASILAKNKSSWLFVGSRMSGKAGRHYPQAEIQEAMRILPYGSQCTIVEVPLVETGSGSAFDLLVFTGGITEDRSARATKEMMHVIEREMGKEFLPDRIHFFPLCPRRDADGNVDHAWCQDQYLTGGLMRKSQDETYRCLAQLRKCLCS